tara:strand:+ start:1376 stop:1900 length:525 start_codon:yes stop_codon:yes gene_type:complete
MEKEKLKKLSEIKDSEIEEFSFKNLDIIGKITNIYDADTCKVCFYYNENIIKINCRLVGIDSAEIKPSKLKEDRELEKKASKIARNRLIEMVTDCKINIKEEYKKKEIKKIMEKNKKLVKIYLMEGDKYGRILIKIYDENNECVNDRLIKEGYAYKYEGGTKRKFKDWFDMKLL